VRSEIASASRPPSARSTRSAPAREDPAHAGRTRARGKDELIAELREELRQAEAATLESQHEAQLAEAARLSLEPERNVERDTEFAREASELTEQMQVTNSLRLELGQACKSLGEVRAATAEWQAERGRLEAELDRRAEAHQRDLTLHANSTDELRAAARECGALEARLETHEDELWAAHQALARSNERAIASERMASQLVTGAGERGEDVGKLWRLLDERGTEIRALRGRLEEQEELARRVRQAHSGPRRDHAPGGPGGGAEHFELFTPGPGAGLRAAMEFDPDDPGDGGSSSSSSDSEGEGDGRGFAPRPPHTDGTQSDYTARAPQRRRRRDHPGDGGGPSDGGSSGSGAGAMGGWSDRLNTDARIKGQELKSLPKLEPFEHLEPMKKLTHMNDWLDDLEADLEGIFPNDDEGVDFLDRNLQHVAKQHKLWTAKGKIARAQYTFDPLRLDNVYAKIEARVRGAFRKAIPREYRELAKTNVADLDRRQARPSVAHYLFEVYKACWGNTAEERTSLLEAALQAEVPKAASGVLSTLRDWQIRIGVIKRFHLRLHDWGAMLKRLREIVEPAMEARKEFRAEYDLIWASQQLREMGHKSERKNFEGMLKFTIGHLQAHYFTKDSRAKGKRARRRGGDDAPEEEDAAEPARAAKLDASGKPADSKSKGAAKGAQNGKGKAAEGPKPDECRAWSSGRGCPRGTECNFVHTKYPNRCNRCGCENHWADKCDMFAKDMTPLPSNPRMKGGKGGKGGGKPERPSARSVRDVDLSSEIRAEVKAALSSTLPAELRKAVAAIGAEADSEPKKARMIRVVDKETKALTSTKRLWACDSAASHVVRPPDAGEEITEATHDPVDVELALGGEAARAYRDADQEIVQAGVDEPLLPIGRSARRGNYTYIQTASEGALARVPPEVEARVHRIIKEAALEYHPAVIKNDLTYLTEESASTVRARIRSMTAQRTERNEDPKEPGGTAVKHDNQSAFLEAGMSKLVASTRRQPSFRILNVQDRTFDAACEEDPTLVNFVSKQAAERGLSCEVLQQAWKDASTVVGFRDAIEAREQSSDEEEGGRRGRDTSAPSPNRAEAGTPHVHWACAAKKRVPDSKVVHDRRAMEVLRGLLAGRGSGIVDPSDLIVEIDRKLTRPAKPAPAPSIEVPHSCSHRPYDPACEICAEAGAQRAPSGIRGAASTQDDARVGDDELLLVYDVTGPFNTRGVGGEAYLGVWKRCDELKLLANEPLKDRGVSELKRTADDALRVLQTHDFAKLVLHADREGSVHADEMQDFWCDRHVRLWDGVPYRSNTNATAEGVVYESQKGLRAQLLTGNTPGDLWPDGSRTFQTYRNLALYGVQPVLNRTKPQPFGTLVWGVLSGHGGPKSKEQSRLTPLALLGPDLGTSGAYRACYSDEKNNRHYTSIMAGDIKRWSGGPAWSKTVFALREIRRAVPDFRAVDTNFPAEEPKIGKRTHKWIQCSDSECNKWRLGTWQQVAALERREQEEACEFVCSWIGCTHDEPEHELAGDAEEVIEDDEPAEAAARVVRTIQTSDNGHPLHVARRAIIKSPSIKKALFGDLDLGDDLAAALTRAGAPNLGDLQACAERELKSYRAKVKGAKLQAFAIVVKPREALRTENNPYLQEWKDAIGTEVGGLFQTGVAAIARLEDVTDQDELLPSLLILEEKPGEVPGEIRRKARIVVCGNFSNKPKEDCYSSTVARDFCVAVLVLMVAAGAYVGVRDVTGAYTKTDPDVRPRKGRTFVRPPKGAGFAAGGNDPKVPRGIYWEVLKNLYGESDAGAAWQDTLARWAVDERHCERLMYDDSTYVKRDGFQSVIEQTIVDDLLAMSFDFDAVKTELEALDERFGCRNIKWLHEATAENPLSFGGIDVWMETTKDRRILHLCQRRYFEKSLQNAGLEGLNGAKSLNPDLYKKDFLLTGEKLSSSEHTRFRSEVGMIAFGAVCTRWELLAATGALQEMQAEPTESCLRALRALWRYIRHTVGRHLAYSFSLEPEADPFGGDLDVGGHADANFAAEKAVTGSAIRTQGYTTSCRRLRQSTFSVSTCEAELGALSFVAREVEGMGNMLRELFRPSSLHLGLCGDNSAANLIGNNQAGIRKVRHMQLHDLYIKEATRGGRLRVQFVDTDLNAANPMTKVLREGELQQILPALNLCDWE